MCILGLKDHEIQHFPGDFRAPTSFRIRKVDGCNPTPVEIYDFNNGGEMMYIYIYHVYL